MCPYFGGWFEGMGGFFLLFSFILLLLFLIGIGVLIWWIIKQAKTGKQAAPTIQKSRALDLLDERYAKGEISKEDYLERRETLTGK